MAVATIGAASLAPVFQELCDQVTLAIQNNTTKLKPLLVFLSSTLDSCRDRVINPVQLGRRIMFNQDHLIESTVVEFQKAARLVAKLSGLRSWRSFWNLDSYVEKLLELDRHMRSLMEATWTQEVRFVRQQSLEVRDLMDGMLEMMFDAYHKTVDTETVGPAVVVERASDDNEEAAAVLFAFQRLFEAVREAQERRGGAPWMIVVLVMDIEMTMYSLQPFLEEMATHNRVLVRPIEEVRRFRGEMEKGLEVVKRSVDVGKKWEGNSKKYECVVGLMGLNQCLQREVGVMRRQMARNAVESLDWVRKMERTVSEVVSIAGVQELAGVSGTA